MTLPNIVPYVAPHDCKWRADDEGTWSTACGNAFCFIEGTPSENYSKFCAYCGGNLVEVPYVDTDPEDDDDEE